MLSDELLGIVRAVEVLAGAVLSWTSVVTANDEVRHTKVLSNDGVPKSLARSTHSHGQRQESQVSRSVRVSGHQAGVHSDTRVVVDITWLGHTDNRVNQDVGLTLSSSSHSELTVSSVHWVTSLEGNDVAPSDLAEVVSQLGGSVSESDVVVVSRL